jgi:hypothetical protein
MTLAPDQPATVSEPSSEVTLQELFDMDPLKLSDRDLDRIIEELRKDRARYITTGVGTKQGKTAKAKEVDQAAVDLLSDLGL